MGEVGEVKYLRRIDGESEDDLQLLRFSRMELLMLFFLTRIKSLTRRLCESPEFSAVVC